MRGIHGVRCRDYVLIALMVALFSWAYTVIFSDLPTPRSSVAIGDMTIMVEIARTSTEQKKGLSGRLSLSEGEGMLFVFDHLDRYGFWMPDMHFAIDIIWIDSDGHIVDITHDVTPESYPAVFTSSTPAQYALEVPAGSALRYGWKIGDNTEFQLEK